MTQNQAMGRFEAALKGEQDGIKSIETAYNKARSEVQYLPEKERKAAMAQLDADRQAGIESVQQRWRPVQQAAAVKAGIPTNNAPQSSGKAVDFSQLPK